MLRMTSFLLIISSLILLTFGCSNNNQCENEQKDTNINLGLSENKFIHGKVLKKDKVVILELIGDSKIISDKIIVSVEDGKMLGDIEEGEEILVWYDFVRESYPPKTRGLKIKQAGNNE